MVRLEKVIIFKSFDVSADRTVCVKLRSDAITKTKVPVLKFTFTLSPVAFDSWTPEKSFELRPPCLFDVT